LTSTRAKVWTATFVACLGILAMSFALRIMDDRLRTAAAASASSKSSSVPQPRHPSGPTEFATASLLRAAVTGNLLAAKNALDQGVSPDVRDRTGNTPLCLAARYGRIPMMRLLMAAKADVNAHGVEERTALHWAASGLQFDIIMELLAKGADPTAVDADDQTPRDLASESPGPQDQVRAVCELLEMAELGK
jgi:ankyrin repeat protein